MGESLKGMKSYDPFALRAIVLDTEELAHSTIVKRLSADARSAWMFILCHTGTYAWDSFGPHNAPAFSLREIADICCLPLRSAKRTLRELESVGLIRFQEDSISLLGRPIGFGAYVRVDISADTRARVFERDNHVCKNCGSGSDLTVDHILAVTRGGSDDLDNLQTLCATCNASKGNR